MGRGCGRDAQGLLLLWQDEDAPAAAGQVQILPPEALEAMSEDQLRAKRALRAGRSLGETGKVGIDLALALVLGEERTFQKEDLRGLNGRKRL